MLRFLSTRSLSPQAGGHRPLSNLSQQPRRPVCTPSLFQASKNTALPYSRCSSLPGLVKWTSGLSPGSHRRLVHTSRSLQTHGTKPPNSSKPSTKYSWAYSLGLLREDGSDNTPRIFGVAAVAFLLCFGLGVGIYTFSFREDEDSIEQLLLLVGTKSGKAGANGALRALVYDCANPALTPFQDLHNVYNSGWMSVSPEARHVLSLESSPSGSAGAAGLKANRLSLLAVTDDSTLRFMSQLDLPSGTWGPGSVEYVGAFPTHLLAVVTNSDAGKVYVVKQYLEGTLELSQTLSLPRSLERPDANPCHAVVTPPYVTVPDAGTGLTSFFRLKDSETLEMVAVAPIAPPGSLSSFGIEYSPRTHSAFLLEDGNKVRSLPWPEGDLSGWGSFKKGVSAAVGSRRDAQYRRSAKNPDLPVVREWGLKKLEGNERKATHLVLEKCAPDINPGFVLVADESTDSISTITLDRKTGALHPKRRVSTWSGGVSPKHMSLSPDGRSLFVVNSESGDLAAFSVSSYGFLSLQSVLHVPGIMHVECLEFQTPSTMSDRSPPT